MSKKMRINDQDIITEDIFGILLENFPDIIHSVDDEGKIIFTNKKAEELLGYTRDELLSMNIRQIYAPEILEQLEKGFKKLKQTGDSWVESQLVTHDGLVIPVEIRSFSIYDDDDHFIRTFSILRDIRPLKELQESLIHAGRLAAIGELASGVVHDVSNPLAIIAMANEMIETIIQKMNQPYSDDLQQIAEYSNNIKRASASVYKLVEHLRNFSRGMVEEKKIIDLQSTIADALFIAHNKIRKTNITIVNEIKPNTYFTIGCPNKLEQVFVNLITNACDAMASISERKLCFSIQEHNKNGTLLWKCDVADTGKGIPVEIQKDIFQSFYTTKEKDKGTGLGLSIARGIVSEHGGEIEVKSEVNKGSTFSVYLPICNSVY